MIVPIWKNKQVWLAVLAVVQSLVLHYLAVPSEIWQSIDALIVVLIGALTVEQVATIRAETYKDVARTYSKAARETLVELRKMEK